MNGKNIYIYNTSVSENLITKNKSLNILVNKHYLHNNFSRIKDRQTILFKLENYMFKIQLSLFYITF